MGDELNKWLLKEGGGCIFRVVIFLSIFLKNMPTSHTVSLALVICACSDSSFCHVLAYTITAMVHVCLCAASLVLLA